MSAASIRQLEGEEMRVNYEGFAGGDRTRIELPAPQTQLLNLLQANRQARCVCELQPAARWPCPWEAANIPAIVQAWYPGEEGGRGKWRKFCLVKQSIRATAGDFLSFDRRSACL